MNLLIVRNNSNPQAIDASLLLATYLQAQNINCEMLDSSELASMHLCEKAADIIARGVDMAVVLGGDGTILRTARSVAAQGTPILGINFGRLGFLANSGDEGVVAIVAAALADELARERRANLRVDVVCAGEYDPWGEADAEDVSLQEPDGTREEPAKQESNPTLASSSHTFFALNEAAITRGALGRIIDFSLSVSDVRIADLRGDGLVVATATGSSAYALSAGGPLVAPSFMGLVVVPIAPHTLHSRSIVTAENDVVEVDLSDNDATREVSLFIDGDIVSLEAPIEKVYVRRGEVPTTLLRYRAQDFYTYASKVFFE